MSPNDYPDPEPEPVAHVVTERCGCPVWEGDAPHDVDDCLEAQADWLAEQMQVPPTGHDARG